MIGELALQANTIHFVGAARTRSASGRQHSQTAQQFVNGVLKNDRINLIIHKKKSCVNIEIPMPFHYNLRMAFDGITMACMARELNNALSGGRISRIVQPEEDEVLLQIHSEQGNHRLLIRANASLPLIYLTAENRPAPQQAPNFCMVLRKYLQGGRITEITQPGLERVLHIRISHLDEMGDPGEKLLIFELMGKHSNLILTDERGMILDGIKHIGAGISSVREVLPGREYFLPNTRGKRDLLLNPLETGELYGLLSALPSKATVKQGLVDSFTGISPTAAQELSFASGIDGDLPCGVLSEEQAKALQHALKELLDHIKRGEFSPTVYEEHHVPREFSVIELSHYGKEQARPFPNLSSLLEFFYRARERADRIRQKSSDLRHIVSLALERNVKKYDLQLAQLKDTEKKDKFRLRGELLHIYGYDIPPKAKEFSCIDYHTEKEVKIPLDPELSAMENAARYYARYEKLKRTGEALETLTAQVKQEIDHLSSVSQFLEMAESEEELAQVKQELVLTGILRDRGGRRKKEAPSKAKPLRLTTPEGFEIYVGKNNLQNEEVTFKLGEGNDWWFHAKKYPGSHVLLKTGGKEVPDRVFEEAAGVAAYFSAGRDQEKVEIDYTLKKNVKKPGGGGPPGYVIYYTNYSMMARPELPGESPEVS